MASTRVSDLSGATFQVRLPFVGRITDGSVCRDGAK